MRNVSDKSSREKCEHTFYFQYFFKKNCVIREIMWENMVQPDMAQMTVLCCVENVHFLCQLINPLALKMDI